MSCMDVLLICHKVVCLQVTAFWISERVKHALHTICSNMNGNQLILLYRFRRSTSVSQTAQSCSCWDCLVRISASCVRFFGRAPSLPILQQSLSFRYPLSKTLRYAKHSNPAALVAAVLCLRMRYLFCRICLHKYVWTSFLWNISGAWATKHASDACKDVIAHHVSVLSSSHNWYVIHMTWHVILVHMWCMICRHMWQTMYVHTYMYVTSPVPNPSVFLDTGHNEQSAIVWTTSPVIQRLAMLHLVAC